MAENVGVSPATGLLLISFKVIVTVEVADPSATTGEVPEMLELAATGEPAVKVTVPPVLVTGVAIERVLTSALDEVIVQVEAPVASEAEQVP